MLNSEIKYRAKQINRNSSPSVFVAGLILFVLSMLISSLSVKLVNGGATQENVQQAMEYFEQGRYEYMESYVSQFRPSVGGSAIDTVLNLLLSIVEAGFSIFIINTVRAASPNYGNLLDGFSMFLRIFLLLLLEGIFILLWSLLLVVPGIIAAYSYRQALYLLIDNPDKSPMQCIRESKAMMKGHKGELFSLDLSFLGWGILAAILPPVSIYLRPFSETSQVLFSQRLAGITDYTESSFSSPDGFGSF